MPFGAFVQVGDGIEGLVHISEMAVHHVEAPEQVVTPGEELWVKIIDIDLDRRRISLSIKQAAEGGIVAAEYQDQFGEHAYDEEGNYIGPDYGEEGAPEGAEGAGPAVRPPRALPPRQPKRPLRPKQPTRPSGGARSTGARSCGARAAAPKLPAADAAPEPPARVESPRRRATRAPDLERSPARYWSWTMPRRMPLSTACVRSRESSLA